MRRYEVFLRPGYSSAVVEAIDAYHAKRILLSRLDDIDPECIEANCLDDDDDDNDSAGKDGER